MCLAATVSRHKAIIIITGNASQVHLRDITTLPSLDRWLSNFWPVEVNMDGIVYPSVEHAYQASKTLDEKDRLHISRLSTGAAKRYGRGVVLRPYWNEKSMRLQIMEVLLRQKFAQPELQRKVLATGTQRLVEGNWWGDTFWGVCREVGRNELGKLLEKIRAGGR